MLVSSRQVGATPSPVGVLQVVAGQQGEAVIDGGGALSLVLVLSDVLLQRLDDDLLLGSAAAGVYGVLEEFLGSSNAPVVAI